MSVYCFDSSAFLYMGRFRYPYYPRDVFPKLWKNVETLIERERLFICQEAFEEMTGGRRESYQSASGADEITVWLNAMKTNRAHFCRMTNQAVQERAEEISIDHPKLIKQRRLRDADPYIIAHAREREAVVVTQELPSQNPRIRPDAMDRISTVCRHLEIPCVDLVGFMRREEMVF